MVENADNINIVGFLHEILKRKRVIISFMAIFFLLGTTYSFLATPLYKSTISIYPTAEENSVGGAMNDIQGVASAFGFNLDGGSQSSFYIPDVVKSRRLSKNIVLKMWNTEAFESQVNLISFWGIDDQTKLTRRIKKLMMRFLPKGKGDPQRKFIFAAIEELDSRIEVKEEDSGLIVISLKMENPQLASDIMEYYGYFIKKYIAEELEILSRKNREFIEGRLAIAKDDLSQSEDELTNFRKKHTMVLEPPDIQLQRGRLMRNVEVNQKVYITLRQQYELARIEELKELPIINILDVPEPAADKDSPKRLIIILGSIIGGVVLGLVSVVFTLPMPDKVSQVIT
ncbi:MAG: hypothetical protein HQ510_05235 [Candidatus Marinimicrobia bacterium]|nr:hypothetical protein [Candidatus Neomarinimicrobiota bacterium]